MDKRVSTRLLFYLGLQLIILIPFSRQFVLAQEVEVENENTTQNKLEEISQRVEAENVELSRTSQKEAQLSAELAPLEESVKKLQAQEEGFKRDLEVVRLAAERARSDFEFAESEMTALKQITLLRLRTLYMNHSPDVISRLMLVADEAHMERNAYYFARIREHDTELMKRFAALKEDQHKRYIEINRAIAERAKIESKIQAQRHALKERLAQKEDLIKGLRQQKNIISEGISKLRAQALRLETVVVSLTGNNSESALQSGALTAGGVKRSDIASYDGPGLEILRSNVPFPVDGKLLKFEEKGSTGSSFGEMVTKKGVEFEVESNTPVKSVAPGRVIFIGRMPGLGNLVIMDHGKRYYSLYGRLGETLVQMGEDLESGAELGKSSQDNAGRVYFEIRKNGVSQDVASFLIK